MLLFGPVHVMAGRAGTTAFFVWVSRCVHDVVPMQVFTYDPPVLSGVVSKLRLVFADVTIEHIRVMALKAHCVGILSR